MAIRQGKYPELADKDWLRDQYEVQGRSCEVIAAEVGCTAAAVGYRLKVHGIKARGRYSGQWKSKICKREGCGKEFTPDGPAQQFCSLECRPRALVCQWEKCGKTFLAPSAQVRDGKKGKTTYKRKFCSEECQRAWRAENCSYRYFNKATGYVTVVREPTMSRRINGQGYAEINIGADNKNGGRVLEHILVMEQRLGRRLYPHEEVHHRNGHRDDNDRFCPVCEDVELPQDLVAGMLQCSSCGGRFKPNLELWTKSQPKGQRVEDKIAWAIEFLGQYGYALTEPISRA